MALEGEVFRALAGRRTLRFTLEGHGYFVKTHDGVGWQEIVKNLVQLRLPVLGARNEWQAIRRLEELGVATMKIAGYGERGRIPARRQSFLVTDELADTVSLEDFCRTWPSDPPPLELKRAIIEKVANIAERLHNNGVNHRDFYICHFLLDRKSLHLPFDSGALTLFLIDLHRVQLRASTPRRWILKDLAGLSFSSMHIGLTRRDLFRFMKSYRGKPLREILNHEQGFWSEVASRAIRLSMKPCSSSD
jgi:heptose I phosphotransferase